MFALAELNGDLEFNTEPICSHRPQAAPTTCESSKDMNTTTIATPENALPDVQTFVDRRSPAPVGNAPVRERRQFTNSHSELSADASELARAIDEYKARHRRRFINYEEVLSVVKSLGYNK